MGRGDGLPDLMAVRALGLGDQLAYGLAVACA
jgi:hypothetical protein